MKTQIETSEKLIKKIKWVIESQDESHKIERLEKMILQIEEFSKMSSLELKSICKEISKGSFERKDSTTFAIAFSLFTKLDFEKILRQSKTFKDDWNFSKKEIFIWDLTVAI
jgi:hypothetical protein